ncbi:MAG TPA: ATP-dependent DNA helicase [Candidatus Dormibacteraeota bacterium]|nr:ATP-dependent DNA helicase [Candidatus Dormibacteraeota bacterium]
MNLESRPAPKLEGDALAAVQHRGTHLQIIASAGSGKTEVVAQRVADLMADQVPPSAIVAFTFTERAAAELKQRIQVRVEERLGGSAVNHLVGLFVGTIHAYCFELLNQRVPRYSTYDVLDDHRLTAFLSREAQRLEIRCLDSKQRLFASIQAFLRSVDVVENELLDPEVMPEPFRKVLLSYYATLDRYHLLTYGQQMVRAVADLSRPELRAEVQAGLRHLIVDEYQDINPVQERLIQLLTGPSTELCVVGDDDQAIYAWRGSDVTNIVKFTERYRQVATFTLAINRRSRPQIVKVANRFAGTIAGRLPKTMQPFRPSSGPVPEVAVWHAPTELEEAGWIAQFILDMQESSGTYAGVAVLVRGRSAYARLMEQFATFGIPVQPGGRTGLFTQPEAVLLGKTICWLTDTEWRTGYAEGRRVATDALLREFRQVFGLDSRARSRVQRLLDEWRTAVPKLDRGADLLAELYMLLGELGITSWDLTDPLQVNRLGTLARFSSLLADYESVRRRARLDPDAPGEQVGGQDRGRWYYQNLAFHIINYASGAYEGFDGEPGFALDAVDMTTIHRAKGLEWPAVVVPSLTASRFPTGQTGKAQEWLVPRNLFNPARYEGSDADERRLFYVAMTRARDWVSFSRHDKVNTGGSKPSPYWLEHSELAVAPGEVQVPPLEVIGSDSKEALAITFSDLAQLLDCGMAYRLRTLIGFQPRLAPELGYGRAVHHVLQTVAEITRATGRVPNEGELDDLLDANFFLPTANKVAHRQLKQAAGRLVKNYASQHADDLHRVWETERPFDLHMDGIVVSGRADVILDREDGIPTQLAILDYKTSTSASLVHNDLQLQVYADAGLREGLDVRRAYVHDLRAARRDSVDVGPSAIAAAEVVVAEAADKLRARDYRPNPGVRCRSCEVRTICNAARP